MITSVLAAVDSQLGQIGDQWPASTAMDLLNRIRGELVEQIERVDALVAGLERDDGADEAA